MIPVALLAALPAAGEEPQAAKDPAAAETETTAAAEEEKEFKIPPGFRKKQRGKHTVYCRKEVVMGTRFDTEKCYDEAGLKEYVRAQRENQADLDRARRICAGQGASCGGT